nr:PREDICTED: uncharacterized protein LOC100877729 isoform X2 [Megachile rotundata]XP_012138215.1 PREDICTED: uncharacterized protein LOC100877729 isoform X2 [Megachile rotundata]
MRRVDYNEIVNTETSQSQRPCPSMRPPEPSRVCCVCKKLFCCTECRDRHEKNKHANRQLNCPLCTSQKLPLKPIEDTSLFCHIVISHLPLHCSLCGEIFKQSKDLESFGTCKWWKARQRYSQVVAQKSLGTPPLLSEIKESECNANLCSLTSPPELYRNTSTPMGVSQKTSFDFVTPNVPNFSLQTPQTNSGSLNKDPPNSGFQNSVSKSENSTSNYVSFPSTTSHEETPFRSALSNRGNKSELPRNNSRNLNIMNGQNTDTNEHCDDNHFVEDMELTGVENRILPDSQGLENQKRRSDSMKRVRFSDQYENPPTSTTMSTTNMTTNDEYYEACDTLSETKECLENSQMIINKENIENAEKENLNPDNINVNIGQTVSGSSRVVMMVVVENNSTLSTSDVIESGLKKLGHIASSVKLSSDNHNSAGCSTSITSVDSYYSVTSHKYRSSPTESNSSSGDSNSSTISNDSNSSGGILSVFANAVRNVMKSFPGVGTARAVERSQISEDISGPSTSTLASGLSLPSLLQRAGKRPRDAIEHPPSSPRQLEFRSPLPKRPRGWYRIKAREPIARMRNNRLTSPRGVSSETQVFHQGSLSVGDTVLPLPSRAHQSTQTD